MDILSKAERSERMSLVRGANTKPELQVRRLLFALGYRYRVNVKNLPGKPDIVFRSRNKIVLIHGCFWHGHQACRMGRLPKSNLDFWSSKIGKNRTQDIRVQRELQALGFDILVVWQCELRSMQLLQQRLKDFLGPTNQTIPRRKGQSERSGLVAPKGKKRPAD